MDKRTRNFLLTVLAMVIIVLLILLANTFLTAGATPTPTFDSSCPTPDETSIPLCGPGGETTSDLTPTVQGDEPGLLGTPAGP